MSNFKDAAEATKGIVEAVPIYQDLLQPAAQELGKGIHTLSKTVHIALSPISVLVWGYDQIKDFIQNSLEKKLQYIPKEDIVSPAPEVAVPAIEALRYTGYQAELREMFSNLLATSMNIKIRQKAHPSYAEIIKQLSPDEAKIISQFSDYQSKPIIKVRASNKHIDHYADPLENFSILPFISNCDYPELGPSYLENITRLGLTDITYSAYNIFANSYDPLENHVIVIDLIKRIELLDKRAEIKRGTVTRTNFGQNFYEACVIGM